MTYEDIWKVWLAHRGECNNCKRATTFGPASVGFEKCKIGNSLISLLESAARREDGLE